MNDFIVSVGDWSEVYTELTAEDALNSFLDEYYPEWNIIGLQSATFTCSTPDRRKVTVFVREAA